MPVPLDKGYADSGNEVESNDPLNDDFMKVRDVKIDEYKVRFYFFSILHSNRLAFDLNNMTRLLRTLR